MNRDDIIRMAREAGILVPSYGDHIKHLEAFASLVAAAEREACAQVAEEPYEFTSAEASRIAAYIRARSTPEGAPT